MTEREPLAWAAGFFDGEGHVRSKPGTAARRGSGFKSCDMQISISQNDRTVLDRFARAVGRGHVNGPYKPRGAIRPYYTYAVGGWNGVIEVMDKLSPWLSRVKA